MNTRTGQPETTAHGKGFEFCQKASVDKRRTSLTGEGPRATPPPASPWRRVFVVVLLLPFLWGCPEKGTMSPEPPPPAQQVCVVTSQATLVDGYWEVRLTGTTTVERLEVQDDGTLKLVPRQVCTTRVCRVQAATEDDAIRACRQG